MQFKLFTLSKYFIMALAVVISLGSCTKEKTKEEVMKEFESFSTQVQNKMGEAYTKYALAEWEAALEGTDENFKNASDAEKELTKLLSNKEDFKKLDEFMKSGKITDPIQKRVLAKLHTEYKIAQYDIEKLNKMTELSSKITQKFQNFRAEYKGNKISDNEVEEILKSSTSSEEVKEAWEASKKVGSLVATDVVELVKMRNKQAQALGYENYHSMKLMSSDQDPKEVEKIFAELDDLTREEYSKLKNEIDEYLAKKFNIKKEELMPWHYQNRYFQEAPPIYLVDLDKFYEGQDLVALTGEYFESIGMDINEMIQRSDHFPRDMKDQHAFCTDIDRKANDIRILCNVKDDSYWMNTMLHEYGHGVYFQFQNHRLPWILDEPAHTFTTEAVAMFFGRLSSNPNWIRDMIGINDEEKEKIAEECKKVLKLEQLVFSRWAQTMYHFEKEMYANPDQDLNALWWEIVEKFQMMKKPEGRDMPDWSTKIHIALFPCYYHNYLLGEVLASQFYAYVMNDEMFEIENKNEIPSFRESKMLGEFFREKVFNPAAEFHWNEMIERATGEKLNARHYAKEFVQ